jgi:3-hydroxyisobutyrate dehydrogenase
MSEVSTNHRPEIAVLGAGSAAAAIVRRLVRVGFLVWVWDPVPARADALAPWGARVRSSPALAAAQASVVVTLLPNPDATTEAMVGVDGAAIEMQRGSLWLQMSNVDAKWSEGFAVLAKRHRLEYVDAQLAGDWEAAEQGRLIVLASAPNSLRHRVQPIFDAISRHTRWFDHGAPRRRTHFDQSTSICW